jgi:hypothetical protein
MPILVVRHSLMILMAFSEALKIVDELNILHSSQLGRFLFMLG